MESSQRKIEIISFVVKFGSRPPFFVDRIYHIELKIKDTADTDRSDSYLSLHLEIDSKGGREPNLTTKEIISILSG
jgi:hypothetical protein